MLSWTLAYLASEWVIRLVMLAVVTRRRQPSAAMAWLLVIFFLPWPGLVLYLLIGEHRLPRRRVGQHARLLERLRSVGDRYRDHPNVTHPELSPGLMAAVTLAERLGDMPILGGNDAELICETEDFLDRLIADVDAAKHHVHLLFYIFASDDTGRRVADALARAVQRGVKCRVLVDAVGSRPMLKRLAPRMIREGIELHAALPVNLFRRRVARMDLRNHRKLAIVDGKIGYTGSQNIVDASYGHKDLVWRDMMVRMTGPILLELQAVFLSDWYFETDEILDAENIFPEPPRAGDLPIQTLPSGPNYPTENYQRLVVAALHAAGRHVIITTPYFVPDEALMQAIQTAVLRGVEVELIVPRRCDQKLVGAASRAYYEDLLEAGAKLHLYTEGLLHAKTMSIDDAVALIGSSNFDIRSFALNFEINIIFYGPEMAGMLRAQQQRYIEDSEQLQLEQWQQRSGLRKVYQNVAKLLSPLL